MVFATLPECFTMNLNVVWTRLLQMRVTALNKIENGATRPDALLESNNYWNRSFCFLLQVESN